MESYKPQEEQGAEQSFSPEQWETFKELFAIIQPFYDPYNTDSNTNGEARAKIEETYSKLKGNGINPQDFFLWSLWTPGSASAQSADFDTPGGDIEKLIRSLKVEEEEQLAA